MTVLTLGQLITQGCPLASMCTYEHVCMHTHIHTHYKKEMEGCFKHIYAQPQNVISLIKDSYTCYFIFLIKA